MKEKTLLKIFIAVVGVIAMASCMENDNPANNRTLAQEQAELNVYIDTLQNRGFDVDTTDLGVYYIVDEEGEGAYPADGDTCIVKYEGYLLSNWALFDASAYYTEDSTYSYVMGDTQVLPGWADGMKVINEGSVTYLIIPSSLAYGSNGNNYNIGPYETLIFRVDMVDIKQAD